MRDRLAGAAVLAAVLGCLVPAHAAALVPDLPGLYARDVTRRTPPATLAGLAVDAGGRLVVHDGAGLVALDEGGAATPLAAMPGVTGVGLAISPVDGEVWLGAYDGTLAHVGGAGGALSVVGSAPGIGGLTFDASGALFLSRLAGGGRVQEWLPGGSTVDVYIDPAAIDAPAAGFLADGDLVVERDDGFGLRRLARHDATAVAAARGGGPPLAPGAGIGFGPAVLDVAGIVALAGGRALVLDGSARELFEVDALGGVRRLATGEPPAAIGGSSFATGLAATPGWPDVVPGGGGNGVRVAVSGLRLDSGLAPVDVTVALLYTTEPAGAVCGDADLDGDSDILDALLIAQAAAGLATLEGMARWQGDVDRDGDHDILDALAVALVTAGLRPPASCP